MSNKGTTLSILLLTLVATMMWLYVMEPADPSEALSSRAVSDASLPARPVDTDRALSITGTAREPGVHIPPATRAAIHVPDSLAAASPTASRREVSGVEGADHQDATRKTTSPSAISHARAAGLDFRGHDLEGADFKHAELANADLREADLTNTDFADADLSGANLEGAVFDSTVLYGTNLQNASLPGVQIAGINMAVADFTGADLRGARLSCDECSLSSDARGVNFAGADLRRLESGRTLIHGAVLDDADLRGANLTLAYGIPKSMRGALYDKNTRFPSSINPEARLMKRVDETVPGGP